MSIWPQDKDPFWLGVLKEFVLFSIVLIVFFLIMDGNLDLLTSGDATSWTILIVVVLLSCVRRFWFWNRHLAKNKKKGDKNG